MILNIVLLGLQLWVLPEREHPILAQLCPRLTQEPGMTVENDGKGGGDIVCSRKMHLCALRISFICPLSLDVF